MHGAMRRRRRLAVGRVFVSRCFASASETGVCHFSALALVSRWLNHVVVSASRRKGVPMAGLHVFGVSLACVRNDRASSRTTALRPARGHSAERLLRVLVSIPQGHKEHNSKGIDIPPTEDAERRMEESMQWPRGCANFTACFVEQ